MEESILKSIKKILSLAPDYTAFDQDVIVHINTAFFTLEQLGVGPEGGFSIEDDVATWEDYFQGSTNINGVKTFIGLKVRLVFDPPANSFTIDAFQKQIDEIGWRLSINAESSPVPPKATWYQITSDTDFPAEAPVGALGYDPVTNEVWRKTA